MKNMVRACRWAAALLASLTFAGAAYGAEAMVAPESAGRVVGMFQAPGVALPHPAAPAVAPAAPPRAMTLGEMVADFTNLGGLDEQDLCLAKAVYFEARGESLEGQLAVARVVLNRAGSDDYPPTICQVVTQKAQFSFIRRGQFPRADESSESWRKAVAVAYIARNGLARSVPENVLWYHADYVSPSWGRRLTQVTRIGAHIFYS